MIHGIVVGKRIWDVDVAYSKFWNPEKFGVKFDKLIDNPDDLTDESIDNEKYKFLIASDVWNFNTRRALVRARNKGLKIFLLPRETFTIFDNLLFQDEVFSKNGKCYFTPDVVMSPGSLYHDKWKNKTSSYVTGHPRFDYCLDKSTWATKDELVKNYDLEKNKSIIFFPSYPIFHLNNVGHSRGNLAQWQDVFNEREETIKALLEFSESRDDVQIVIKIHPTSSAIYRKRGLTKDMEGLTLQYLNNPTKYLKVIDGGKKTRFVSRDILTASDIIVGGNSTMMVEAALVGKPVLRTIFNKSHRVVNMPHYDKVFQNAMGVAEVKKVLSQILDNMVINYDIDDFNKFVQSGKETCKNICNTIKEEMI